ncbi:MAG: valine--tRNA ligase [Elusimicrobiota bacterium]
METIESPIDKIYDPKLVESHWYELWDQAGYFQPSNDPRTHTIVIPPPNVTGALHMGHALNATLQDILTRYYRMKGWAALWVPGTDHGGIATQNVVEKLLMKDKLTRHDLGREKFLERMWAWRKEAGDNILGQSKRLGTSLDWTRARFTMDDVCSKAVRHAFVALYHRKLLYRGKRLVNWCPRCSTALADIEVEHQDKKGHLWHIRYPLNLDSNKPSIKKTKSKEPSVLDLGYIVVATTRPETLLGDTAVAVHPKDKRYKDVIGLKIKLPLTNREIAIVSDVNIDKSFGSGAVKVTPAHDPVDFEIAERNNLPHITVIGFDGKMTVDAGASYAGLDRFDARKKVLEDLESQRLLEKTEDYNLSVSVCYRCDNIIEPLESEQWFLSMKDMAKKAREANKKGKVRIVPESWENPYQLWLRNLKDWCVSRQIWWGHRIPVWYCLKKDETGKMVTTGCAPIVTLEDPIECPACKNKNIAQDSDVLDTWFSSALWPFSVFGWPDETIDLKKFFPTSTLVTGHEILYLWVARMIMFGLEFHGKVPFTKVLIHGIVRDKKGRKMSKSLGNVIDPLELINEFGADAVRFSLAQSAAPGRDMQISKENFISTRNFSNKVWNATRFALMNLSDVTHVEPVNSWWEKTELSDKWILSRLSQVIQSTSESIEKFDCDAASRGLYDFFWSDFCDWYLELIKPRVDRAHYSDHSVSTQSTHAAKQTLATVLDVVLRLLHPFMPFISEELWSKIPKYSGEKSKHLIVALWPEILKIPHFENHLKSMGLFQEIVTKLRNIRSEMGIPISQTIEVIVKSDDEEVIGLIKQHQIVLKTLNTKVSSIKINAQIERPASSAAAAVPGASLFVPLSGLIDFSKERMRLEKEKETINQELDRISKKLSNQDFVSHAPAEEIQKAQDRLIEAKERLKRVEENIRTLS